MSRGKSLTKGRVYNANNLSSFIEFQYNPSEFKDSIGVNWSELIGAGSSYPIMQYSGGRTREISFNIYVNDLEKTGAVRKTINFLHSFLPPARLQGYQFVSPPPLIFSFGWFVKDCLLKDMDITYDYFSNDLEPLMATVYITLIIIQ